MYCGNCGAKIEDNVSFCPACGTKVEKAASGAKPMMAETDKKNRNLGMLIVGVIALVAVIIIVKLISGNGGTGYEAVVKKYFKALETGDAELYFSLMADDYIQDRISGWHYTEEEIISGYQDSLDEAMYKYEAVCGDNIKISYEITDTYIPTENEIAYLEYWLEDYGFRESSIEDAIVVYCDYTVKGSEGSNDYYTDRLIMKIDGKWCITGGYIDLSWYEQ